MRTTRFGLSLYQGGAQQPLDGAVVVYCFDGSRQRRVGRTLWTNAQPPAPSCGTRSSALVPASGSVRQEVLQSGTTRRPKAQSLSTVSIALVTMVSGPATPQRSVATQKGIERFRDVGVSSVGHSHQDTSPLVFPSHQSELGADHSYRRGDRAAELFRRARQAWPRAVTRRRALRPEGHRLGLKLSTSVLRHSTGRTVDSVVARTFEPDP